jgi:hypothetical protein
MLNLVNGGLLRSSFDLGRVSILHLTSFMLQFLSSGFSNLFTGLSYNCIIQMCCCNRAGSLELQHRVFFRSVLYREDQKRCQLLILDGVMILDLILCSILYSDLNYLLFQSFCATLTASVGLLFSKP